MKTNYLTPINSLFLITSIVAIILGNNLFLFFMVLLNAIILLYYIDIINNKSDIWDNIEIIISVLFLGVAYSIILFIFLMILIYLILISKYFTD